MNSAISLPTDMDTRPMALPELVQVPPVILLKGVRSHLNLQYAAPPGFRPLVLDLHVPDDGGDGPRPVLVYAHGGGFFTGTKAMGPWRFLLEAGYAVASVDYRLSGESRFPGPVHDVAAAVRWVRANAAAYGLDPGRIAGFGSSAGGYLLGVMALAAGQPELIGRLGPTPEVSCALSAVVDHYAPTDFLHIDDDAPDDVIELSNAPDTSASRFLGFIPGERPEQAGVATLSRYATSDSPPFLIAHGDADRRVGIGQSRRLHAALLEAGADAELIVIPGADHGGPEFDEEPLHEATLAFLRRVLGES
ncbi:alpha/beta hydrolase [Nonomuraea jabiensis]|uniref:alpha/beta hydrolase n=1 Tax=Nonomuraea jabiensis TaxID=882448 RepID=UPI00343E062F